MGLDMYLTGSKYLADSVKDGRKMQEDGFKVKEVNLKLAYWRKHPNLHGFIIQQFADGVDDCSEIDLDKNNMLDIIKAIHEERLPDTEGFFFGVSAGTPEERAADTLIFQKAIEWLDLEEKGVWKSVTYRASW